MCEFHPSFSEKTSVLLEAFNSHCDLHNKVRFVDHTFGKFLAKVPNFIHIETTGSGQQGRSKWRGYSGLKLKNVNRTLDTCQLKPIFVSSQFIFYDWPTKESTFQLHWIRSNYEIVSTGKVQCSTLLQDFNTFCDTQNFPHLSNHPMGLYLNELHQTSKKKTIG